MFARLRCLGFFLVFAVFFSSIAAFAAGPAMSTFSALHQGADVRQSANRDDVKKGWYWYKVEREKPKDKKKETDKVPRINPWTVPAKEFKKMLNDSLETAVTEPTVDNVMRYVELKDIARKKALAFTNVYQLVVQANPQYNTASQNPTITPGIHALTVMRRQEVSACVNEAADDFAMIYFYKPDCRFCAVQSKILAFFMDSRPWMVKKVNVYEYPDAALRFNVTTVPYILLVSRESGEYMPVSVGIVSLDDLENRLCRSVKFMRHEISPEQFSLYDFQKGGAGDPTTKGIYKSFNEVDVKNSGALQVKK